MAVQTAHDDLAPQAGASDKAEAQAAAQLYEFLRRYVPEKPDGKRDLLDGRYQIDLGAPLPEYDHPGTRAYAATDRLDQERRLLAQVCSAGSVQRHRIIAAMKPLGHPALARLAAAGVVELSQPAEERFVIIHERPAGRRISELLPANPGMHGSQFICERVIGPLAAAIHAMSESEISHGLLNADNVYFAENAMLGPSCFEPCGMSQPFYFETVERMQAQGSAKGEGTAEHDYYALGVLVLYMLKGPQHFSRLSEQDLILAILSDGVYPALVGSDAGIPEIFGDFFLGVFAQNPADRWGWRHIKPWLNGKRFNALTPPSPSEGQKAFDFAGIHAGNRRELAHRLAAHWEQMAEPLHSGQLAHWASVSLRNKPLADLLVKIGRMAAELNGKNDVQHSEQMMRAVLLLDPAGPIRFRQLSMHIDGLDTLVATLFIAGKTAELQSIGKFIEYDMASYWLEQQRGQRDFAMPPAINAVLMRLDRLRPMMRLGGYGFGPERILYELNPDMPCISPLFAGSHVTTLPSLLSHLDRLASANAREGEPLDRHVAAFLAARLGILHEIRLHDLAAVPQLSQHKSIIALHLLSTAQNRVGNAQYPGLTHWLAMRILPTLDSIHSNSLRRRLRSMLQQQAQNGYTQLMAELMISGNYANADQTGFTRAQAQYQRNAQEIEMEKRGVRIDRQAAVLGLRIAHGLATMGFIFALVKSMGVM